MNRIDTDSLKNILRFKLGDIMEAFPENSRTAKECADLVHHLTVVKGLDPNESVSVLTASLIGGLLCRVTPQGEI